MRVFENRVLRRSFGPKRNKVTGKQKRPYNEELHDLYSSSNIFLEGYLTAHLPHEIK